MTRLPLTQALWPTLGLLLALLQTGCSHLPSSGPSLEVTQGQGGASAAGTIQVVELSDTVARRLAGRETQRLFSEAFPKAQARSDRLNPSDVVEITLVEAPPATLFGGSSGDPRLPSTAGVMNVPAQAIDAEGFVSVPFVGRVRAAGETPHQLAREVVSRLKGKANQPDVLVRVVRSDAALVTVVGEVAQSTRMPLNSGNERVLDALAAAGGVRQAVNKSMVQLTRADGFQSLPLDRVIRDPRQNVLLQPGDVVSVLFQPHALTVLGATGKQDEIPFEAQGITLAQALARAGGLIDNRASAQGVFLFRLEPGDALDWPSQPVQRTPEGKVPVVYRLDLRDPRSFFVMNAFRIKDADLLYVSNAPATELQKFLNLVFSAVFPVANLINATTN